MIYLVRVTKSVIIIIPQIIIISSITFEVNPVPAANPERIVSFFFEVVDLHADELLDTTQGMQSIDILNYQMEKFREKLAEFANKKGQKIVFIHGKGEGVLRRAIINELNYRYKKYTYQDASFQEYGYGATQVTIR